MDAPSNGSFTFSPEEAGLPSGTQAPSYGHGVNYDANGNPIGLTPQQQGALMSAIGSTVGMAGTTIAAILQGNNATDRANLASQVLLRQTQLQTSLARAQADGQTAQAQTIQRQLALLQPLSATLAPTSLYGVPYWAWGAGALALLGIGAYVVTRPKAGKSRRSSVRKNPSCGCHGRRGRARKNPCGCAHAKRSLW